MSKPRVSNGVVGEILIIIGMVIGMYLGLIWFTDTLRAALSSQKAETIEAVVPAKPVIGPRKFYHINLNQDFSLSQLLSLGHYVYINERINDDNFRIDPTVWVSTNMQFEHFNSKMSFSDVIVELDKKNLQPANLAELLAFRAEHLNETFKKPIVAFGSPFYHPYGWYAIPYIQYVDGEACLDLTHGDIYDPACMIAAVPIR